MVSADTTYTTIGDGIIKSYDRFDDSWIDYSSELFTLKKSGEPDISCKLVRRNNSMFLYIDTHKLSHGVIIKLLTENNKVITHRFGLDDKLFKLHKRDIKILKKYFITSIRVVTSDYDIDPLIRTDMSRAFISLCEIDRHLTIKKRHIFKSRSL
jgi:hypothetical protein